MVAVRFGPPVVSRWNDKHVVTLGDGAMVEAVRYRGDTLCVSSQVGCAVSCPFCASGADGLQRGLRLDELRGQVLSAEALGGPLRRVTVSGVGEPLHNPAEVLPFLAWCRERGTPASVTTSGGPLPRLEELIAAPHNGVTISVHAGTEDTRAQLVPKGPSLDDLFDTLTRIVPTLSRKKRKKLALAYLMVEGANDTDAELDAFAARVAPLGLAVHLYALNPVPTSEMRGVSRAAYEAAYERLRAAGLVVRMSSQARIEANGGCGTLVALRRRRRGML